MEALFNSLTPAQKEGFLNGPALPPPPGVLPNFTNPQNGSRFCIGIEIAGISLATLVVLMRIYTKIFCVKKMRVEDYLTIAALGLYIGFIYIAWNCFIFPGGFVHQWNIRVREVPDLLKRINQACILYGVVMLLLKISILLDWIHIFAPSHSIRGTFYWACVGNIVVSILFYLACVLVEVFACTPREKIWNLLEHGTCINVYAVNVASSVFNFVLDLVMLGMPQHVIWRLTLSTKKKFAISSIFAIGAFGCICGALRIVYSVPFMQSPDKSYHVTAFGLAALGEMTVGFLVLCFPSLPKLVKSTPILERLFSTDRSKTNSRLGLPSWIRGQGQRHAARTRMEDTNYSEFDGHVPIAIPSNDQFSQSTGEKSVVHGEHTKGLPRIVCTTEFITMHEV